MKLKFVLVAIFIVILTCFGCGLKNDTPVQSVQDEKVKKIVTSFYPIYIMALNITEGINGVQVVNMTKPSTGCLHDYQLTPKDLVTLQEAKIFIINGAGMESFLDKIIVQYPDLNIVDASKGISLLENSGHEHEHEHEIEQGEHDHEKDQHDESHQHQEENHTDAETHNHTHADPLNPHLWVSVTGAISQVKSIEEQLSAVDPDHSEAYHMNAAKYVKKLEELRNKMHSTLDILSNRDIITFHEAFPYFAQEFGLNIKAVIQREPGSEPSAKELAETISIVKSEGVKVLFAEPQYSAGAAETIARETGAKVYYLDPAVIGPSEQDAYIKIMESNLAVLEEALK